MSERKRVTPHTLRHVFTSELLDAGANLRQIKELSDTSTWTPPSVTREYSAPASGRDQTLALHGTRLAGRGTDARPAGQRLSRIELSLNSLDLASPLLGGPYGLRRVLVRLFADVALRAEAPGRSLTIVFRGRRVAALEFPMEAVICWLSRGLRSEMWRTATRVEGVGVALCLVALAEVVGAGWAAKAVSQEATTSSEDTSTASTATSTSATGSAPNSTDTTTSATPTDAAPAPAASTSSAGDCQILCVSGCGFHEISVDGVRCDPVAVVHGQGVEDGLPAVGLAGQVSSDSSAVVSRRGRAL